MERLSTSSVFAGMMISAGCTAYLKVGGVQGAVLFSIGLLGVVVHNLDLFTGKAGYKEFTLKGFFELFVILAMNFVGTYLFSNIANASSPELSVKCLEIIQARMDSGCIKAFPAAIGCGMMMSLAIGGVRKGSFIPLLFAVPCFIVSGFYHCVADLFYLSVLDGRISVLDYLPVWLTTVAGNWLGCNLHRFLARSNDERPT